MIKYTIDYKHFLYLFYFFYKYIYQNLFANKNFSV